MKRYIFIAIFAIVTLATSCEKFLDTAPTDFLAPETYYTNETQLTTALMAVYSEMGNINEHTYSRFLSIEAPGSNDEEWYRSSTAITTPLYNTDAAYSRYIGCWQTIYSGIGRANALLENIDKAEGSVVVKNAIKGEAMFMRAYYYFVLVSYWGDVPLVLNTTKSPENTDVERTPQADIYKFIIKDMTTAEGLVYDVTTLGNPGRVSKTTAEGILARVCLYAAGRLNDATYYPQARDWALKCMKSNKHSLNPDYRQIFINHSADRYDLNESMWEVEFFGTNTGTSREYERFGSTIGVINNATDATDNVGFMQGTYASTGTLFNSFNSSDLRRDWAIGPFSYTASQGARPIIPYANTFVWGRPIAKWRRDYQPKPQVKNFGNTNWPLLRYADVLLMFAEAENQVNGSPTTDAYDAINMVRRRALGTGNKVATIAITNGGSGYTTVPLVKISSGSLPGGINNSATAYATVSGGKVTTITISSPGAFYGAVPTITFEGTTGTGATATATIIAINPSDANLTPSLDKFAFFNALKDERSRELCFEGFRKLDLVRWGIFLETMKNMEITVNTLAPVAAIGTYQGRVATSLAYKNATSRDVLFPIPALEFTLNSKLTQNTDW
ncbi:hypothetical protein A5893_07550 [Pedobacter psychrophilus]|uniref:Carbohydrate-binding protein SusD n=1 Tax=Pedobacter psychrophilus TaxID=1826909 RepID=A0A179DK59_9SPHI|nr:RagB/SusD family nutrient uptake outer membrane protein [Pedobacter psychrophilus]OAQ40783.1 hypothetical protein A5893_07550 [Pedobacter psychrophilus]